MDKLGGITKLLNMKYMIKRINKIEAFPSRPLGIWDKKVIVVILCKHVSRAIEWSARIHFVLNEQTILRQCVMAVIKSTPKCGNCLGT